MKRTFENDLPIYMGKNYIFFKSTFLQWIEIISEVKDLNPLYLLENARKKNLSNTGTQSHITPQPLNRLILLTLRGVRQKQNLSFI